MPDQTHQEVRGSNFVRNSFKQRLSKNLAYSYFGNIGLVLSKFFGPSIELYRENNGVGMGFL